MTMSSSIIDNKQIKKKCHEFNCINLAIYIFMREKHVKEFMTTGVVI